VAVSIHGHKENRKMDNETKYVADEQETKDLQQSIDNVERVFIVLLFFVFYIAGFINGFALIGPFIKAVQYLIKTYGG
jgi:hypothetical protein